MSSKNSLPPWEQAEESQYFNWHCVICSQLAQFPMHIEDQWLVEHGPHLDLDGVTKWVKCSKCFTPYHVVCLKEKISVGEYICSFMGCQN